MRESKQERLEAIESDSDRKRDKGRQTERERVVG